MYEGCKIDDRLWNPLYTKSPKPDRRLGNALLNCHWYVAPRRGRSGEMLLLMEGLLDRVFLSAGVGKRRLRLLDKTATLVTLSCLYSRFSDSFHIIYIVRWEIAMDIIFSVSALFRHKRMFGDGRIFSNRVVYNKCDLRTPYGRKLRSCVWKKPNPGIGAGEPKLLGSAIGRVLLG